MIFAFLSVVVVCATVVLLQQREHAQRRWVGQRDYDFLRGEVGKAQRLAAGLSKAFMDHLAKSSGADAASAFLRRVESAVKTGEPEQKPPA